MTAQPAPRVGEAARRLRLPDGGWAQLDGPLTPGVPLVLLLHGFRGGLASMAAAPSGQRSWREALLASGFSTLSYEQTAPDGLLAPNLEQLIEIAAGPLSHHSRLRRLPLAIVAHSRGGLLARLLVDRSGNESRLRGVVDRLSQVITLHTPHQGSGLAALAIGVDRTARRLQSAVASLGLRPAVLAALCSLSASPAVAELAPGSPTLRALARRPAPTRVPWHTFGGISADLRRICTLLGPVPADGRASAPARLARTRGLSEVVGVLDRLALLTPALREGEGDVVVADASARLPFAASHTVNRLTHVEAFWDVSLQRQVIALLSDRCLLAAA